MSKPINFPYFVAQRIRARGGSNFSALISRIAIGSIALGLAAMIISSIIFQGFRGKIQDKIFAMSGHIQATKFDLRSSYEELPVSTESQLYRYGKNIDNVSHIQVFSHKSGLLKTKSEVMGVVLKGVSQDFDTARFSTHLIAGEVMNFSEKESAKEIVISKIISDKLELDVADEVIMYFVQEPPRARKFTVKGIYETGIEDFDQRIIIGSNAVVQRLNNWGDTLVGGYEIFLKDFQKIDQSFEDVYDQMDFDLQIEKVTDRYLHLFDWFLMVNRNVVIFLTILLFVASFNIVSITLIMIMERTNMIGTLKALGADNGMIQKIFIFNGFRMLFWGLLIGNLLGIGFGLIQSKFKLIPLDPENYYMDAVPIQFEWLHILGVNSLIVVLVIGILFIPTLVISRIELIKSIKFS